MRFISFASLVGLSLLFGALARPLMAEEGWRDENRGQRKHEEKQQRKDQKNWQHRKDSPKHVEHDDHPRIPPQQAREWQQQRGWQREDSWHGHEKWEGGRASHWEAEHRTWVQRGGYRGYYIPRYHYHRYFGHDHWFRIRTRPVVYMGYPRFYYRGYSFLLVDPWPEDWDENWYESDDVYIDYAGGYYLYNRRHPGIALAITVVE